MIIENKKYIDRKKILIGLAILAVIAGAVYFYQYQSRKNTNVGLSSEQVKAMKQSAIENIKKEYEDRKASISRDLMMKKMACSNEQKSAVTQDIENKKSAGNLSQEDLDKLLEEGDSKIAAAQEECAKKYETELQKALAGLDKEEQAKIAQIEKNPVTVSSGETTEAPAPSQEQAEQIQNGQGNAVNKPEIIDQQQMENMQKMQDYIKNNPDKMKEMQDKAMKNPMPQDINPGNLPGQTLPGQPGSSPIPY
jgi:hypothetical protein